MIPGGYRLVEYPSRADTIRLYWTGDWHVLNRGCAIKQLAEDIQVIADDPHAIWLGGGDYADCIGVKDSRFDPEAVSPDVKVRDLGQLGKVAMTKVRTLMEPIKAKCAGLLYGNHEAKYMLNAEAQHLHSWLCTDLGVPALGYSTVFQLRFRRRPSLPAGTIRMTTWMPGMELLKTPTNESAGTWTLTVFAHHGAGAAQTPGGKLNKLRAALDYFACADIVLLAHVHEQKVEPSVTLDTDQNCTTIRAHVRKGAISGTYLRTYAEGEALYGEQKLYRPVPLGMTVIEFTPDKHKFMVEM